MSQSGRFISNSGGGGFIQTITGNTGVPVVPTAGNVNIIGSGIVSTNGVASTLTISVTNPIPIANGGTNATSMATTFGVNYFDGTRIVTTAVGTAGQILTSNGVGVAPTFQAAPSTGITSITGDSGGAQTGPGITITGGTTGLTFAGAANTETLGGTLVIANGGTNATSMSTTNGIVKYDGTRLVTSTTAQIDASNRYTNTSQPAFLAYLGSSDNNVTGAGTIFTIGSVTALTEVFDQGGDFNTNGTFTTPVTGRYTFHGGAYIVGCTIATSITLFLDTSNRSYRSSNMRTASNIDLNAVLSSLCDMDIGDTAILRTQSGGEAGDTDDVFGSSDLYTFFSGNLEC